MAKKTDTTARVRRTPEGRVVLTRHHQRSMLHADFSHGEPDEILDAFRRLWSLAEARTAPYCILYDVRGNYGNEEFVQFAKSFAAFTKKQGLSTGSAVIGITGIKRILARAIKPDMYWAKDKDDALRWLTQPSRWERG